MKLIHLSDLHLVTPGGFLHGLDPQDRLRRCVAHIRSFHADAAFVVLTGDLTHGGEPAGYEAARAILAELPMPLHVTIGNHDNRDAFRAAFPQVPVSEGEFVQEAFDMPQGRFVVLDTHEPGRAEGGLCDQRLGWLERELRESVGPVFLCLHHPPFPVGLGRMDRIRLLDGDPLLSVLRAPEPLSRRAEVSPDRAAACLSLAAADVVVDVHLPQVVSVGMPFLVVELASRDVLRRASPDRAAFVSLFPLDGAFSVYAYTRDIAKDTAEAGTDMQARMFTGRMTEDPATGSATSAMTALLAERLGTAELSLRVGQGTDMGRPSLMLARTKQENGAVVAFVGGRCVEVMEGTITSGS